MTTQTRPDTGAVFRPIFAYIAKAGRLTFDVLANTSRGARCARVAERLFAMSDQELARRGLRRDEIIQHAFGPYLNF